MSEKDLKNIQTIWKDERYRYMNKVQFAEIIKEMINDV